MPPATSPRPDSENRSRPDGRSNRLRAQQDGGGAAKIRLETGNQLINSEFHAKYCSAIERPLDEPL